MPQTKIDNITDSTNPSPYVRTRGKVTVLGTGNFGGVGATIERKGSDGIAMDLSITPLTVDFRETFDFNENAINEIRVNLASPTSSDLDIEILSDPSFD